MPSQSKHEKDLPKPSKALSIKQRIQLLDEAGYLDEKYGMFGIMPLPSPASKEIVNKYYMKVIMSAPTASTVAFSCVLAKDKEGTPVKCKRKGESEEKDLMVEAPATMDEGSKQITKFCYKYCLNWKKPKSERIEEPKHTFRTVNVGLHWTERPLTLPSPDISDNLFRLCNYLWGKREMGRVAKVPSSTAEDSAPSQREEVDEIEEEEDEPITAPKASGEKRKRPEEDKKKKAAPPAEKKEKPIATTDPSPKKRKRVHKKKEAPEKSSDEGEVIGMSGLDPIHDGKVKSVEVFLERMRKDFVQHLNQSFSGNNRLDEMKKENEELKAQKTKYYTIAKNLKKSSLVSDNKLAVLRSENVTLHDDLARCERQVEGLRAELVVANLKKSRVTENDNKNCPVCFPLLKEVGSQEEDDDDVEVEDEEEEEEDDDFSDNSDSDMSDVGSDDEPDDPKDNLSECDEAEEKVVSKKEKKEEEVAPADEDESDESDVEGGDSVVDKSEKASVRDSDSDDDNDDDDDDDDDALDLA